MIKRGEKTIAIYSYQLSILIALILLACNGRNSYRVSPKVTKIFPSSDTLPANLLRMYVQFSEPMKTTGNLEKIVLLDENEREVKGAIFNNVYELWDKEQLQLTLIFDPARVKTGLQANEKLGRALKPNKNYQLILEGLETIDHRLISPYAKRFFVDVADTIQPNINNWNIAAPKIGTSSALKISLQQEADWMSLNHRLLVTDETGSFIDGRIEIGFDQKEWSFFPTEKWERKKYFLNVNTRFADPCGNNLNGLFNHSVGSLEYESEETIIKIPFFPSD